MILIYLISTFIFTWLIWRFASYRYTLPCPSWLGWMVEMDNPFTKVNRAQTIIEHLAISEGMRVLDVGCGPGRVTVPLARFVGSKGSVVALDMQQGMLDRVQKKAEDNGISNITYICENIESSDLEEESFDRIVLATVLGEIPDKKRALRILFKLLKSNGILAITEVIFDPHFQWQSVVRDCAQSAGFKKIQIYGGRFAYTMLCCKEVHR